jgi:hypothetical protein
MNMTTNNGIELAPLFKSGDWIKCQKPLLMV